MNGQNAEIDRKSRFQPEQYGKKCARETFLISETYGDELILGINWIRSARMVLDFTKIEEDFQVFVGTEQNDGIP